MRSTTQFGNPFRVLNLRPIRWPGCTARTWALFGNAFGVHALCNSSAAAQQQERVDVVVSPRKSAVSEADKYAITTMAIKCKRSLIFTRLRKPRAWWSLRSPGFPRSRREVTTVLLSQTIASVHVVVNTTNTRKFGTYSADSKRPYFPTYQCGPAVLERSWATDLNATPRGDTHE